MSAAPLLDVRDLRVTYRTHDGEVPAVAGVSFTLAAGESLALVGESGCGKSTVALALMGLLPRRAARIEGQAWFRGEDLLAAPPARLRALRGRAVGIVFQDPVTSLNPFMRVGGQVVESLRRHRGLRGRARCRRVASELLAAVGFTAPASQSRRYPHELSGGMCQRAMIASAASCQPALLIADEPTTALDVLTQWQVLELLRSTQQERGLALLLITHDLGIVSAVSHCVAVMRAGRIVETGATPEVYARPAHAYTRALLAAVPRIEGPRLRRLAATGEAQSPPTARTADLVPAPEPAPAPTSRASCPTRAAPLLEIRDLHVTFHARGGGGESGGAAATVRAVEGVSFALAAGEAIGLVGESGSGKSTLVRAILQLIPASAGSVRYEGAELCGLRPGAMRRYWRNMQLVFQDPFGSLNGRMTIGRIVAEPLTHYGLADSGARAARVARLLERVQIDPDWQNRYPHELSGGQRQRVGIARALACEPRILFCDEPVSSLDVSVQAGIVNLLRDLRDEMGLALVFISHDLAVVRHLSDRVAVMYRGRIVDWVDPDRLRETARDPYTVRLLAAVPAAF